MVGSRKLLRLIPAAVGLAVAALQVGPQNAEVNLCGWIGEVTSASDHCLHGIPLSFLGGFVGLLIAGGLAWFLWPEPRLHSSPKLEIRDVQFDPNLATEMYVDFTISNPGAPTIIKNWKVAISWKGHKLKKLVPRYVSSGRTVPDGPPNNHGLQPIKTENLLDQPLEQGGLRNGRLGFTFEEQNAKALFNHAKAKFHLSAEDIHGHMISASHILSPKI